MKSRLCPYCGTRIEVRSALCPHCGRPLPLAPADHVRRFGVYLATSGLFLILLSGYNQTIPGWVGIALAGAGVLLFIISYRR